MKKKILMYMCEKCGTWYTTFPSLCPVCNCPASELFEVKVKSLGKNEEIRQEVKK